MGLHAHESKPKIIFKNSAQKRVHKTREREKVTSGDPQHTVLSAASMRRRTVASARTDSEWLPTVSISCTILAARLRAAVGERYRDSVITMEKHTFNGCFAGDTQHSAQALDGPELGQHNLVGRVRARDGRQ